jgi:hypothetical protein
VAVLAMLEIDGDSTRLMAASAEIDRRLPQPNGLLVRMAAPTGSGMVLFQLWDSAAAREENQTDPKHREALEASGMTALATAMRSRTFDGVELRRVAAEAAS